MRGQWQIGFSEGYRFPWQVEHSSTSLHKLEQDRICLLTPGWQVSEYRPRFAERALWASTGVFKALTGGDVVGAEYKYLDLFDFIPFVKLIFLRTNRHAVTTQPTVFPAMARFAIPPNL